MAASLSGHVCRDSFFCRQLYVCVRIGHAGGMGSVAVNHRKVNVVCVCVSVGVGAIVR